MRYAEARRRIRDGDLIAIRSNHGGLPALTRSITGSPYTHTGVAIWMACRQTGGAGLYIAEMDGVKGVLTPLSQYADLAFDVYECPVSRSAACTELLSALRNRIDYDYWDLIRIAAHRLWNIGLPKVDKNGLICSALSARIYRNAGWVPAYELPSIPAPVDTVRSLGSIPYLVVRP